MGDPITPRPGDGRISRKDAARLVKVDPKTITAWIARGHLKDVRKEGRSVWLMPAEVIEAAYKTGKRERRRIARLTAA